MSQQRLDQIAAEVEIGEGARKFKESDLGRTVLGIAKQEVDAAMLDFAEVDLKDETKVRSLQLRVKFGLGFEQWITELITKGNEALEVFKQHESKN